MAVADEYYSSAERFAVEIEVSQHNHSEVEETVQQHGRAGERNQRARRTLNRSHVVRDMIAPIDKVSSSQSYCVDIYKYGSDTRTHEYRQALLFLAKRRVRLERAIR